MGIPRIAVGGGSCGTETSIRGFRLPGEPRSGSWRRATQNVRGGARLLEGRSSGDSSPFALPGGSSSPYSRDPGGGSEAPPHNGRSRTAHTRRRSAVLVPRDAPSLSPAIAPSRTSRIGTSTVRIHYRPTAGRSPGSTGDRVGLHSRNGGRPDSSLQSGRSGHNGSSGRSLGKTPLFGPAGQGSDGRNQRKLADRDVPCDPIARKRSRPANPRTGTGSLGRQSLRSRLAG